MSMEQLLEKLLLALVGHEDVGPTIAQIALEGYSVRFNRDGESPRMWVIIYKYDEMGSMTRVANMVDVQLVLEKLVN